MMLKWRPLVVWTQTRGTNALSEVVGGAVIALNLPQECEWRHPHFGFGVIAHSPLCSMKTLEIGPTMAEVGGSGLFAGGAKWENEELLCQ